MATLYGIGVGPGDKELLTVKAVRIIEKCQVVVAPCATEDG
jgi:precorrin-2/cobalt-factor-2 C20-methyltransferase